MHHYINVSYLTFCFLICLADRCEDGPVRDAVPAGSIPVDIEGETSCTNKYNVTGVGLCSGKCYGEHCPEPQCAPTALVGDEPFKQFIFECASKTIITITFVFSGHCVNSAASELFAPISRHLKLELLTQIPASNDENYVYL